MILARMVRIIRKTCRARHIEIRPFVVTPARRPSRFGARLSAAVAIPDRRAGASAGGPFLPTGVPPLVITQRNPATKGALD